MHPVWHFVNGAPQIGALRVGGALSVSGQAAFTAIVDTTFSGGIGITITEDPVGNPVGLHGMVRTGKGQIVVTRNIANTGDHILLGANLTNTDDTAIGDGDYVTNIRGPWVAINGSPVGPSGDPFLIFGSGSGVSATSPAIRKNGTGFSMELGDRSGVRTSLTLSYLEGFEMTAPEAPTANGGRIFFQDNGAGKTQLMVRFSSGAAQQVAIEP